jgi:hypothetical protein
LPSQNSLQIRVAYDTIWLPPYWWAKKLKRQRPIFVE